MLRLIPILFSLLLACGCAKPPATELQAAQQALAQAYASGASDLAPNEYQAAREALLKAEDLIRQGHFVPARELLPFASAQADQAADKALREKTRLEQERLASFRMETDIRRQTFSPSPPKRPEIPKPAPKPVPPPPLLDQYALDADENLWDIAARAEVYNDPLLWPLLYKANRDQIKDPRKIHRGQVLTIPRDASEEDQQVAREEARESNLFSHETPRPQGLDSSQ